MNAQTDAPKFDINALNMADAVRTAQLKKKISVKTVFGKPDSRLIWEGGKDFSLPCVRVVGSVNKLRTGQGDFGPWVAFKGSFIAVNLQTGESFKGSELFLPEVASDLIENAVIDADGATVNIAFDIEAIRGRDEDSFEYTARPHMEVEESDPLLMLAQSMDNKIKGLAAPQVNEVDPDPAATKENDQKKNSNKGSKK